MLPLRHFSVLLSLLLLNSCNRSADTIPATDTDHAHMVGTAQAAPASEDQDQVYSIPDSVAASAFAIDTTGLSPEPDQPIKILIEGLFHKEEVWAGAENKTWIGLIYANGRYETRSTTLQVETAYDPVRDAETVNAAGRKVISGRQVTGHDTTTLLFITGLSGVQTGTVDTAAFDTSVLKPGRELPLRYKGKTYTLAAFGDSTLTDSATHTYAYGQYGWKIRGTKNGKKIEQLIAQDDVLDNSIYVLHWAGDLDRDGIPDLITDLSNHHNLMKYALFLSSRAGKGELYKRVAVFESNRK
ncbi:hypothetical protein [Pontibacter beigongshangensis]|uniref:hypothetical protein n=1 Tax=Pontibacter beigongshangensis TaxID=2574733 RepID=UPI0016503564|nr:hypothetical protein [Pontibacter beigongshangensis]